MFKTNDENSMVRSSDVLRQLVKKIEGDRISIGLILNHLGDRSFGLFLVIISAIGVIPLVAIFTGLITIIIGIQIVFGFKRIYLPKWLLNKTLPSNKVIQTLNVFIPKVQTLEYWIKPRFLFINHQLVLKCTGVLIIGLGVINMIPIPLTNVIPGLVVLTIAIGMIERDGLLLLACFSFTIIAICSLFLFLL